MEAQRTRYGWVLRLDAGEEIVETLTRWAAQEGVRGGALSGIGAVGDPELGFYRRDDGSYVRRRFEGEYEIGMLTGNLSVLEGAPFPHCHIVIGGEDFVAHTGHLFEGRVTVTCEIHIVTTTEAIRRVSREGQTFKPLDLSSRGR